MASSRVLVVGSGGREHALVWKLASERGVSDIVCAPGNAGIARLARCIAVDAADPHALVAIAKREAIDFTIVGPELPLSRGVADVFADEGLLLFGPSQRAARLESSKVFAKEFMQRNAVPTARYKSCDSAGRRDRHPATRRIFVPRRPESRRSGGGQRRGDFAGPSRCRITRARDDDRQAIWPGRRRAS